MGTLIMQRNLDFALKSFEKIIENVALNGNEGQKVQVLEKLKDFNDLINSRKNQGSPKVVKAKTPRRHPRKVEIPVVPYEIWVKIMNYLPTKDIFLKFAFLNKFSYHLTKDTKALKNLTLYGLSNTIVRDKTNRVYFSKAMKILKKCTSLEGLTIDDCSTNDWHNIVEIALKASPNIKYLKLLGAATETSAGYYNSFCNDYCNLVHGKLKFLTLFKNLVEFCATLHEHELVHLAGQGNLQTLKLDGDQYTGFGFYLQKALDNMNLTKLKYLSLNVTAREYFCTELANHYFPALERIYICKPDMKEKCFVQLIMNCPKLKSIQFEHRVNNFTNTLLHKICTEMDVFVIFGKVIKSDENKGQKAFEEYLIENDVNALGKYNRKKNDFSKWCKNNVGYGF